MPRSRWTRGTVGLEPHDGPRDLDIDVVGAIDPLTGDFMLVASAVVAVLLSAWIDGRL